MNIDVEVPCTVLANWIQEYITQQFFKKWDFSLECKDDPISETIHVPWH